MNDNAVVVRTESIKTKENHRFGTIGLSLFVAVDEGGCRPCRCCSCSVFLLVAVVVVVVVIAVVDGCCCCGSDGGGPVPTRDSAIHFFQRLFFDRKM